ncbi:MAG TPA: PKD domain-containing protein, partial [Thermoplasmata archaeon]|nr:PKD domain-containing protein [Thermoplasmata archaeon]
TLPYNVTWALGNGTVGYGDSVAHDFPAAGVYVVEVRLSDAAGGVEYDNLTVDVTNATNAASSPLSGNFGPGLLAGLILGGTAAAVILFSAERSRRRRLPGPPSPYVPPSGSAGKRRG